MPDPDALKRTIVRQGVAAGTRQLSRRQILSATAGGAVVAWGLNGLTVPGAGAAVPRGLFTGSVIDVRDYGAKGEDLRDDTRALQAAIRASREGDALYFPPGTYLVSAPLLPKPHQLFFSIADGATVKARTRRFRFPIFFVRSGPVEFQHLTIDGANNQVPNGRLLPNARGIAGLAGRDGTIVVVVSACRVQNTHSDGISIAGGSGSGRGQQRVIVRDTVVENCGQNGLTLGRVENIRVESSRFERCNNGVKMLGCEDVVVHGVTAEANRRHGIAFTFSHRWHVDNCVAANNGSRAGGGWGILAGGEDVRNLAPNSRFTITDNICEHNLKGGISIDPTMAREPQTIWDQSAKVSGNVCEYATLYHGIHLTHARDVLVTDNVCAHNRKGSGIQLVNSSHVLVQGNACFANRYGIAEFEDIGMNDPGHHVIGTNMLYDNTKGDLRLVGR
jgi:hypothetical protein